MICKVVQGNTCTTIFLRKNIDKARISCKISVMHDCIRLYDIVFW